MASVTIHRRCSTRSRDALASTDAFLRCFALAAALSACGPSPIDPALGPTNTASALTFCLSVRKATDPVRVALDPSTLI